MTDTQLDESLDFLHSTVVKQEKNKLVQLQYFYNALHRVAYRDTRDCVDNVDCSKSDNLKLEIRSYFTSLEETKDVEPDQVQLSNENIIAADIRRLISTHKTEHNLTGRSIARILHGIGSPNFPPIVWGRTKFWRLHIKEDFNLLCSLANQQLVLMR